MTSPAEVTGTEPGPVGDPNTEPAPEAGTVVESEDEGLDPKIKAKLDKANREAQSLRQRLKDAEPAVAELKKIRDGELTELQRATAALAEREAHIQELTVSAIRRDAALAAGLDPEFIDYVNGSTKEEAEAQAKKLAAALNKEPKPQGPANFKQGAARGSTPAPATQDRNALIRKMAGFQ